MFPVFSQGVDLAGGGSSSQKECYSGWPCTREYCCCSDTLQYLRRSAICINKVLRCSATTTFQRILVATVNHSQDLLTMNTM